MDAPIGMILAAGLGTRMRPLTDVLPKPLLPFLNTPVLAYTIDHLVRAGVRRIGINVHHLADRFAPVVEALERVWRGAGVELDLVLVHEPVLLGTGGGIAGIWRALGSPQTTAIVVNGDPVFNADLGRSLERHRASGHPITMLVRPLLEGHPGGVFVEQDERIVGLRHARGPGASEASTERAFMGIHLLEPATLRRLADVAPPAKVSDVLDLVTIPMLVEGTPLGAELIDDFWVALDTPALLLDATHQALATPGRFAQSPVVATWRPGLCLLNPAGLDGKALLAAPLFLGVGVTVGAGAQVGPVVVADHTDLAPGAVARNAILFGMGRIEGTWVDCVAINGQIAQRPERH